MPRNALRLQVTLDRLTPTVRREMLRALTKLQQAASIEKIVNAIERGDFWSLERLVSSLPKDLTRAGAELQRAFNAGLRSGEQRLPVTVRAGFKGLNPAAAKAARESSARFVTSVTEQTRKAIRTVIARSFREGQPVREVAKQIKPLIGLTERQAAAVIARRAQLSARGLTSAQIEKAAKVYAEKLRTARATLIARTEIIKASTDGQLETWKQAKAQGLLSDRMRKSWITTPDDRLCPICRPLDGQRAAIDGTFSTRLGPMAGPPLHPGCRCALGLVEVRAAKRVAA